MNEPCLVCGEKVETKNIVNNIDAKPVFCPIHKVEEQMMKELDQLNAKLNSFIDEFKVFKDRTRERICKFEIQEKESMLRKLN